MTKKHFQELATNLFFAKPEDKNINAFYQWQDDCEAIADACKRFNSAFDKDRFLNWCNDGK